MFSDMLDTLRERVTFMNCRIQIQPQGDGNLQLRQNTTNMREVHETPHSLIGGGEQEPAPQEEKRVPFQYNKSATIDPKDPNTWGKVSRNDPCPCGSGLKYKHCHGKIAV